MHRDVAPLGKADVVARAIAKTERLRGPRLLYEECGGKGGEKGRHTHTYTYTLRVQRNNIRSH